jgi:hypothetical protein
MNASCLLRTLASLVALTIALSSTGCTHRAKWLHGSWIFDREFTEQKLAENSRASSEQEKGLLGGLKSLATGLVVPQLIAAMDGTQIEFTEKEIIKTDTSGNGRASSYEIVGKADAQTITVKQADGEVATYHREGDRFWQTPTGAAQFRVYFRRLK